MNCVFYQYTALSSRAADSHEMYSGGSIVGKASLIIQRSRLLVF